MSDENENFNEIDNSTDVSNGNFIESDSAASDNFSETENFTEGNFNEVDNYDSNSDEGNFNEVGNVNNYTSGTASEASNSGSYSSGSLPAGSAPSKGGSPKAIIGVVVALALVIVGLIVFLVISIMNKKDKETNVSTEPTKIQTEISVEGDPAVTDSASDSSNSTSNTSDDTNSEIDINDIEDAPVFNVTVELGQYKGIQVDYDLPEVTEEDVNGAVEYFASTLEAKEDVTDRPLESGDIVLIDYVGTMDGEVFDGGSATGVELTLGSHRLIDGFEDGLIGKKVGDSVSLDLTFPDPYTNNPDYSGKPVNFLVNINEAYNYVTPELTDELVAENSEYQTIAEYTEAARAELERQAIEYADSKSKNDIIQKIIEGCKFGGQIEEQIAYEEQDCIEYYDAICQQQFGISGAVYFGYLWGITEEEYYAMVSEESATSVKYNAILDEIAKQENLTVSNDEYEAMFQETFIDYYGFESKEEVYDQIGEEEVRNTVNGYVLHDKAEAIIFDTAIINK